MILASFRQFKQRTLSTIFVIFLLLTTGIVFAQDLPDAGLPDSVQFGEARYVADGCSGTLRLTLPVYLWSDSYSDLLDFGMLWKGNAVCEALLYFRTGNCDSVGYSSVFIDPETKVISGGLITAVGGMTPTIGTEKLMELIFSGTPGDSLRVLYLTAGSAPAFHLGAFFEYWVPTCCFGETFAVQVPDIAFSPGDANSSGTVSISDAVYLIKYIFAGGCPPFDPSSADVNGSCTISISDAVYLINYIFAGGDPPLPGCVSP